MADVSGPKGKPDPAGPRPLTARELTCLQMLADGHRSMRIANELSLATVTIEMHLRNARHKLEARTMSQAVAIALRKGLIR